MDTAIRKIYILHVEAPGDYLFIPSALVILLENSHFTIYSSKSEHNLLKAAVSRHSWPALEEGITFRGANFRLEDMSEEVGKKGWTHASSIPRIVQYFYDANRKHLFFLASYLSESL